MFCVFQSAKMVVPVFDTFCEIHWTIASRNAWAYMYDGKLPGIGAHADDSQLQINIYVTPSEAMNPPS